MPTSRWTWSATRSGAAARPSRSVPTEFRLLRHFLEHPRRVFSRERLLDQVWGHDSDIELRTVDVHIRRLRKAINANGAERTSSAPSARQVTRSTPTGMPEPKPRRIV